MDDSVLRSAPNPYQRQHGLVADDGLAYPYIPSTYYESTPRSQYLDPRTDRRDNPTYKPDLSYDRDRYSHESLGQGLEDHVTRYLICDYCRILRLISTRTNSEVACANATLDQHSKDDLINPMMTMDGGYPRDFDVPLRLYEFMGMSESRLDRIILAYDSGYSRTRHQPRFSRVGGGDIEEQRRRNLITLFEMLGAVRLADYCGRSERANTLPGRGSSTRYP